ncbi:Polyprenyl synthetase [Caldicellulosiruptor saccharolyticus DSM 8903]|uniref:Farnesyl diphosphate synthase n=1 Tax=Caldicellulosiruptor saccharolyticus (strain ATCC 43494 / DSM 8903 / Tp8T 6331) TaxID=351627 RepID=A4XLB8_CALS8|nr:farnesyl diphosphate synthase [Caldicellulosiruptor saccharolyticus]ABP67703.1 Polyprenyl synthetase [Caldicellulosiruptor saccharolyticus DSM 8903]
MSSERLTEYLKYAQEKIDKHLDSLLGKNSPDVIYEAMRYSVFAGGKRLRPILCLLSYELLSGKEADEKVLDIACAIELIHTYSLIHDDLPAMDNDVLRRGKPTNHVVFGEAIAILAGDALLNKAAEVCFNWILRNKAKENFIKAAEYLFKASGTEGMIGGQVIDVVNSGKEITEENLLYEMHLKKTSKLIQASCVCGAYVAGAKEEVISDFEEYGKNLGLAFQIRDDILDFIGDSKKVGKSIGKDIKEKKNTFVTFYGIEKAQNYVESFSKKAIEIVEKYDRMGLFIELTNYLITREK